MGADHNTDINDMQREKVKQFREKMLPHLQKYPAYDTFFALLRWLRAYRFDSDIAAERMVWSLNTLGKIGAFDKDFSSVESIHREVREVTPTAEYFPGGILGVDRNGFLINMHNIGRASPRSLIGAGRISEFYIAALYDCEGAQAIIRKEEAKRGCQLGAIMIVDMNGFSFDTIFHIPATRIYANMLSLIQTIFPDTARKLYVVNAPLAFNFLYQIVKVVLAKETIERFQILGSDWKEILIKNHGAENLPESCGGTKSDILLRKGGVVPDSVKLAVKKVNIEQSKLSKVIIRARSVEKIPFDVPHRNSKIFWYFTCSHGDIDFAILHGTEEVWPNFRLSTQWSPEFGELLCLDGGTYELSFSNRHGTIWSKEINYYLKVTKQA